MGNNSDNRIKKRTDIITDEPNQYERVQRDADSKYAWEIKKAKPTFKQVLPGAIIISAIIIAIAIVCSAPKKSSTNTNSASCQQSNLYITVQQMSQAEIKQTTMYLTNQ